MITTVVTCSVALALLITLLIIGWRERITGLGTEPAWLKVTLAPVLVVGFLCFFFSFFLQAHAFTQQDRVTFILGRQWRVLARWRRAHPDGAARSIALVDPQVRQAAGALSDNRGSLFMLTGLSAEMSVFTYQSRWFLAWGSVFVVLTVPVAGATALGAWRGQRYLRVHRDLTEAA